MRFPQKLVLAAVLFIIVVAGGVLWLTRPEPGGPEAGLALPAGTRVGGAFALIDDQGRPVTDQSYRGHWVLVYFGYTFCPDVCPTTLQTIATALDKLGKRGEGVIPLFITVDPSRDTPAVMARYVHQFDSRIVGLTGSEQQIAVAAKAYRVYYQKETPKEGGAYTMDHSSFIYLMDPEGGLAALFGPQTNADELAAAIGQKLGQDK
jgi:protein SCO1/2